MEKKKKRRKTNKKAKNLKCFLSRIEQDAKGLVWDAGGWNDLEDFKGHVIADGQNGLLEFLEDKVYGKLGVHFKLTLVYRWHSFKVGGWKRKEEK